MGKLYPPTLQEKIPAFYNNNIQIPLIMNPLVSYDEVKGFHILIKSVSTNTILHDQDVARGNLNKDNFILNVRLSSLNNFQVGQYYKIQVAYVGPDEIIGYYSPAGIIKFTNQPKVSIDGLNANMLNNSLLQYNGIYSNLDQSEKVYSYEFKLYQDDVLIETSGVQIHNNTNNYNNSSTDSYDSYIFKTDINAENHKYKVTYEIITANNLKVISPTYNIISMDAIDPGYLKSLFDLNGEIDKENGVIKLKLNSKDSEQSILSGKFVLCRKNITKQTGWYSLVKLNISRSFSNTVIYIDYLIEQGNIYKYSLQQFTEDNLLIDKLETEEIYADFFHMFLYDGEKQLKIEYNPKVTSFKTDLSVTKIDTLGSRFPVFLKGGNINYKEFPISGLISYHMDNEKFFSPCIQPSANITDDIFSSFDLTDENFYSERTFKLAVLDFLNDGKPKIFKSPAEGTYIVMLMNSSLSPEDKLSRMIHTFSCTAYEYQDFSYDGLIKAGFINMNTDPTILDIDTEMDEEVPPSGKEINMNSYYKFVTILLGHDLDYTLSDKKQIEDIPSWDGKNIDEYITYLYNISSDYVNAYKPNNNIIIKHNLHENILPGLCSHIQCENMLPGTVLMINNEIYTVGPTGYLTISYDDFIIYDLQIIKYGIPQSITTKKKKQYVQDYLFGQITCKIFDEDKYNDLFNQKKALDVVSPNIIEQCFDLKMFQEQFNKFNENESDTNDLISVINKRNNLINNIYIEKYYSEDEEKPSVIPAFGFISNNTIQRMREGLLPPTEREAIPWITFTENGKKFYKQELKQINYLKLKGKNIIPIYVKEDLTGKDLNQISILKQIKFFYDENFTFSIGQWTSLNHTNTYLIVHTKKNNESDDAYRFENFGYLSPDILNNKPYFSKNYNPMLEITYNDNKATKVILSDQELNFSDAIFLKTIRKIEEISENQVEILINYSYVIHKTSYDYNKRFKKLNSNILTLISNYNELNDGSNRERMELSLIQIDFLKQKYLELIKIFSEIE